MMISDELGRIPMSPYLTATLTRAADYATAQSHREVTLEHLLLALAEDPEASVVLKSSRVDIARLVADVSGFLGRSEDRVNPGAGQSVAISQDLRRVLEAAAAAAQQGRRREINGAIVLAAIVGDGKSAAANLLRSQGLTFEEAIRALREATAPPPAADGREMTAPPVAQSAPATTEEILATARERVQTRGSPARREEEAGASATSPMDELALPEAAAGASWPSVGPAPRPAPEYAPMPMPRGAGSAGPIPPPMPPGFPQGRVPPQAYPGQAADRRRAGSGTFVGTWPLVEAGQLVENIPRRMKVGIPVVVEARVARSDVKALADGLQGSGAAFHHEMLVTKAMSVRLRAPDGGFWIETRSPETQWIENILGLSSDDFASWRWTVTPRERGRKQLQLIVSARTVGADGVTAETALPDQVIEVRVGINLVRTFGSWTGWIAAAVGGGLLARFGEGLFEWVSELIARLIGGGG